MSWGFRFQSATVLVETSITKSLFIVLSKCLLLGQFCLAHVFSPGTTVQALWKSVLLYWREFPNLCLLASLIMNISGSNSSVECTFSFCKLARLLHVLLMTIIMWNDNNFYGYFQIVFLCLSLSYIVYNEKLNRLLKPITYIGAVFVEKTNRTQFIMLMYNILFI